MNAKPNLTLVSSGGKEIEPDVSSAFIAALSTLGDGVAMESFCSDLKTCFQKVADGEAEKGTVTLTINIAKCKKDAQLFEMSAKSQLKTPAQVYGGVTFVNKGYLPERNRNDGSLYHSRGQ